VTAPEEFGAGQWDMQVQWLDPDQLIPNPANPNQQADAVFNGLVASIEQEGWTVPITAVQAGELPDGRPQYRIVAGEHRWRAAKILGCQTPVIALDPDQWDEDRQAWNLVKDNVLKGNLNPERFAQLYERLTERYEAEVMQVLMGFTSEDAFQKVYKEARAALPEALQKALDKQKGEIKTIDGLAAVLNGLFREFGETLPSDFMTFAWGSKDILWTMVRRRKTWDTITAAAREADQRGLSFAEVVATALTSHQEQENHDG